MPPGGRACPQCGARLDGASAMSTDLADEIRPKPGMFAVCCECGAFLQFAANLEFRAVTEEQLRADSKEHPDLIEAALAASAAARQGRAQGWQVASGIVTPSPEAPGFWATPRFKRRFLD